MPIRFRCRYCNQLMGISRRKAGMMVHCPTCHAEVVVPTAENEAPPAASAPEPAAAASPPLFERSDFEAFLEGPAQPPAPAQPVNEPAAPPPPLSLSSPYQAERLQAPSLSLTPGLPSQAMPGLVLSPTQATWLTVVAILLLALAFGAGLLVGHYCMN
jgi:phage FluMu protein Com